MKYDLLRVGINSIRIQRNLYQCPSFRCRDVLWTGISGSTEPTEGAYDGPFVSLLRRKVSSIESARRSRGRSGRILINTVTTKDQIPRANKIVI